MLNKEEKRIMKTYILPLLEKYNDIYFNMDKKYEEKLELEGIPEGEYNKKVFPYRDVMSDLWDIIFEIKKFIRNIYDEQYTKKTDFGTRWKAKEKVREKERQKEKEIRDEAYKKGQEMAAYKYKWLKLKTAGFEGKKANKIHSQAYSKGLKAGKEMEHLTEEQILRKAKQIELEIKLGFKEDLEK